MRPVQRLICTLFIVLVATAPARGELTHVSALSEIYDSILAAQFETAEHALANACPPAPAVACQAIAVAMLWWKIALNPESRALDAELEREAAAAIDAALAWTRREPHRAEAWFYHAAAHAPLVQWRLLRGERLAAVRAASRVKASLERALELDPHLHDARFGIGAYRYYAAIAPTALQMLRWILALPGGDREEGLRLMEQARQRGQLLQGETDYQLHFVYLWYENQAGRALELLEGLKARYPTNPLFHQRVAAVQRDYFHDYPASVDSWQALLQRAEHGNTAIPELASAQARLGLAETHERMFRSDLAIETLERLIATAPVAPPDALAPAYLQLARAQDRIGDRERAIRSYREAVRRAPAGEAGDRTRDEAADGLDRTPSPQEAEAYRLSIAGLNALEAGAAVEAVDLLAKSMALEPNRPVSRARYARALIAAGRATEATAHLEAVLNTRSFVPPFVRAAALVDLAGLRAQSGDAASAIDLYRRAIDMRGGEAATRAEAQGALERLVR